MLVVIVDQCAYDDCHNQVIVVGGHMLPGTRERMIRSATELLQERGYAGVSFQDVLAHSGAPRGSIYHHFPGGKDQLVAEALSWYAQRTSGYLTELANGGGAVDVVAGFVAASKDALRASGFRAGCPVAAVALDLGAQDQLLTSVAAAFADWRRVFARALRRDGVPAVAARRLATWVVASIEGALLLARADHDTAPLHDVGRELTAYLRRAIAEHRAVPGEHEGGGGGPMIQGSAGRRGQ
jgi:TetR/AcrR family transcriptional regulator, lmrAB and yxaGH operons repressor